MFAFGEARLKSLNLRSLECGQQGNCLYQSAGRQMRQLDFTIAKHTELRRLAVAEANRIYRNDVNLCLAFCAAYRTQSFDHALTRMAAAYAWGESDLELRCIANIARTNVKRWNGAAEGGVPDVEIPPDADITRDPMQKPIMLIHYKDFHYRAVIPLDCCGTLGCLLRDTHAGDHYGCPATSSRTRSGSTQGSQAEGGAGAHASAPDGSRTDGSRAKNDHVRHNGVSSSQPNSGGGVGDDGGGGDCADPFASAPPIFDIGNHTDAPIGIRRAPRQSYRGAQCLDDPFEEMSPFGSRVQWLLHGLSRRQTLQGDQGESMIARVEHCLRTNSWCYEGLGPSTGESFLYLHPKLDDGTPSTITDSIAHALVDRARRYIDDDWHAHQAVEARLQMKDQPYERFAWVEHVVWAWNVSKGVCWRCCEPYILETRLHESQEAIGDQIGKKARGGNPKAFTLQRRWNEYDHVGSNICGGLCATCQNLVRWNGHEASYSELGGPVAFWNDAVKSNQLNENNSTPSYRTVKRRVAAKLAHEGIAKCSRDAQRCCCPYHVRMATLVEEEATRCGTTVDALLRARSATRRSRQKSGTAARKRPHRPRVVADTDTEEEAVTTSENEEESEEVRSVRSDRLVDDDIEEPSPFRPRRAVRPREDDADDIEEPSPFRPRRAVRPREDDADRIEEPSPFRPSPDRTARYAAREAARVEPTHHDPIKSPSPFRSVRKRPAPAQNPMHRAMARGSRVASLVLAASAGQACNHRGCRYSQTSLPLLPCARSGCSCYVHLRCFTAQAPRLAATCQSGVVYCFSCARKRDQP
jgi:hypothetical protein